MNKQEHLLSILAEECAEVAHRASKALRFGLDEIQPGQSLSNKERIELELADLMAVVALLDFTIRRKDALLKKEKIENFLRLSKKLGTLQD